VVVGLALAVLALGLAAELFLVVLPLAGIGPSRREPGPEETLQVAGRAAGAGVVLVVAMVPFLLLAFLVVVELAPLLLLDRAVVADAHEAVRGSPALLAVARGATALGDGAVRIGLTALTGALLLSRRQPRAAVFVVLTVAVGAAANTGLKVLLDRARPVLPDPIAVASGRSFPSGHAMGAAVLYGTLLLVAWQVLAQRRRRAALALTVVLVGAVAASRVLLGVHYLTDVLAGVLAGGVWIALAVLALRGWHRVPARE
jgi:undecaprenyl-diphosphatase